MVGKWSASHSGQFKPRKNALFASKMLGESQRQFGYLGEEKSAIPARYQSLGLLSTLLLFNF